MESQHCYCHYDNPASLTNYAQIYYCEVIKNKIDLIVVPENMIQNIENIMATANDGNPLVMQSIDT